MNNTYQRPVICWGNSFYLYISLQKYNNAEWEDFDLSTAKSISVYLICATHNTKIPLDYEILGVDSNSKLKCFVDYRLLHTTSYGVVVEGDDENDMHFRWCMLPKEGMLVISNTSGQKITDDVQTIDLAGRVGWGIQTSGDLSDYYTKEEADALLDEKASLSTLSEVATTGNYNDLSNTPDLSVYAYSYALNEKQDTLVSGTNIKTINNESILGSGNITIEGGGADQVQSDWTESDTSSKSYIKHKPDLSVYAYTYTLSQVATTGNYNDLSNKPDLSVYAYSYALNEKQDTLVSGTNIKTINNESILGSGNITIEGGGSEEGEEVTANALYDLNSRVKDIDYDIIGINQNLSRIPWQLNDIRNEVNQGLNSVSNELNKSNENFSDQLSSAAFVFTEHKEELDLKQEKLVSGTNIKTINNESILGSGNITIEGGGSTQVQANWNESDSSSYAYILNKPDLTVYAYSYDLATVATTGNYNDLSNKPDLTVYAYAYTLSQVATTGNYNDLSNTPDLSYKVSSTTQNLSIEVVSALPATPDNNVIYICTGNS